MDDSNRARGCDVSHWNTQDIPADWDAVINGGISFVGIKTTQGQTFVDPTFGVNRIGVRARAFDLVVYYHFAAPGDPAKQAAHFLDTLGELRGNERLCLDLEDDKTGKPAVDLAWADAFYDALPTDRTHIMYTSRRVWLQLGNPAWSRASKLSLWLPRYGPDEPEIPAPWKILGRSFDFWQYSEEETVDGITGKCDASVFNGDVSALRAYAGSSSQEPLP